MTGDIPGGHGMRIGEMYMLENNEGRTGRFIIQELAQPYTGTPEFQEIYRNSPSASCGSTTMSVPVRSR